MLRKNAYDLFLSLDDVEKIHESTLRVLKEVGVEFKHEEVLDVFKKHGARVENSIVYLYEDIINNALQTVPKSFELHGRAGFSTISVDGAPVITTAGGPPQLVHEDDSIGILPLRMSSNFTSSSSPVMLSMLPVSYPRIPRILTATLKISLIRSRHCC